MGTVAAGGGCRQSPTMVCARQKSRCRTACRVAEPSIGPNRDLSPSKNNPERCSVQSLAKVPTRQLSHRQRVRYYKYHHAQAHVYPQYGCHSSSKKWRLKESPPESLWDPVSGTIVLMRALQDRKALAWLAKDCRRGPSRWHLIWPSCAATVRAATWQKGRNQRRARAVSMTFESLWLMLCFRTYRVGERSLVCKEASAIEDSSIP